MREVGVEELCGFRVPSEGELAAVVRYAAAYFQSRIRTSKMIAAFLTSIGFILLLGSRGNLPAILFGVVLFAASFACVAEKNRLKEKVHVFEAGNFRVLDGTVCEITVNYDTPGVSNVKFLSCSGQKFNRWCGVRQEALAAGTPLLLVYVDKTAIRGGITWAFTPFMLTKEGIAYVP